MPIKATQVNGRLVIGKRGSNYASPTPNNKYRAIRTTIDGITFDSRREAERYMALKYLLHAGEIKNLRLQVPFEITVNNQKICTYYADFTYFDTATGKEIVEDSKGMKTRTYRLKKKLMLAVHNIEVIET